MPKRVVIVGAGFGGLEAARVLGRAPKNLLDVTVIDRRNHHLFQPLLYQVAMAGLAGPDIAAPIRRILRKQKNTTVLMAEVEQIDPAQKTLRLRGVGELSYDLLIVAAGATHSYFGHDDWAPFAPGLKTIEDAFEIRRRVLCAFEAAEREPDPAIRQAWLSFVVVGGGPTGVELAGSLGEIARFTMTSEFRNFDPRTSKTILLEGGPRILPSFKPESSAKAVEQLAALGVEVRTGAMATAIDATGVTLGGAHIAARTVLWAAGVAGAPLARSLGAPLDRAGRVRVEPDLSVPGHPEIFVVGDLAAVIQDGKPVPGVAPAANQGGRLVAQNILRELSGQPRQPFRYVDKGSLATIGRSSAVAEMFGARLSGFVAWAAWLLIHILFLIGFRNRFVVLFEWAWAYWSYQRGARVIVEELPRR